MAVVGFVVKIGETYKCDSYAFTTRFRENAGLEGIQFGQKD